MNLLEDAIDIHVHAAPELFQRVGDAVELAELARANGMSGLVLKAHHESSVSSAYFTNKVISDFTVWGGIVLNEFVGGINPSAVNAAIHQGARLVWGPTLHARHHIENLGGKMFGVGHMSLDDSLTSEGVAWTDSRGALLPEATRILKAAGAARCTVATGHASNDETRALVKEAASLGTPCLVTHGFFLGQDEDFLVEMAIAGAIIEISASLSFPFEHYIFRRHGGGMRLEAVAALVDRIGPESVVISSDCGQLHNASPIEALRSFLSALKAVGTSEDAMRTMICHTPRRVLGLASISESAGREMAAKPQEDWSVTR